MSASIQPRADAPREVDVAILGGGIGGLAAAAALRTAGIAAHVYEKTRELKEVGGAVVIREPSVRLFESWGAAAGFHDQAVQIELIELRDQGGQPMGAVDLVQLGEGKAYSVHRADVHARLLAAVDPETVHLGMKSLAVREEGERGVIQFEDGREVRAKLVVGADGIKSVARRMVSDDELIFAKLVVYRGLAPSSVIARHAPPDRVYSWGKEPRMMVLLPLRGGAEFAMDTVKTQSEPPPSLWTTEVPTAELLAFFEGFDPAILRLIEAGTVPVRVNPVYERDPIESWSTDRVTLLGDAAHPMAPRMGQGANQAIQDADALARALGGHGLSGVPAALRQYEQERIPVTKRVQLASRQAPKVQLRPIS